MLARLVTMTAAAMELLQTCVHIECMYLILKKTHFEYKNEHVGNMML